MAEHRPDICVIGAGSAGLSVAAGAAQMGASVVLVERGAMGGDCLNTGCVPSKALLAAAHQAEAIRQARGFGIAATPVVDFAAVHAHVHAVIASIAPHDSVERFEGLGVSVIQAQARFISRTAVVAGDEVIRARRFVIASGSRPAAPQIPGLGDVGYLTNETIFDLKQCPSHLVIIGGGPIGCELAQAFRRLGAAVALVEAMTILPKDDPTLSEVVRSQLLRDGVTLHEKANVAGVAKDSGGVAVTMKSGVRIAGSHLLVATGRLPNVDGLALETAGVAFTARGIAVTESLRTTNRRIYAIGDCIGGPQFTHVAGYHAGIVIREMLFRLPARADHRAIPAVTYTDPEIAQVGMTEAAAREAFGDRLRVLTSPFAENDRARAERKDKGLIKVITTPRGRILGVGIVGAHAGELIQPWVLAIANRLKVGALATVVAPYPTFGEINKRAAGTFFTPSLYGPRVRALVRFLSRVE